MNGVHANTKQNCHDTKAKNLMFLVKNRVYFSSQTQVTIYDYSLSKYLKQKKSNKKFKKFLVHCKKTTYYYRFKLYHPNDIG